MSNRLPISLNTTAKGQIRLCYILTRNFYVFWGSLDGAGGGFRLNLPVAIHSQETCLKIAAAILLELTLR